MSLNNKNRLLAAIVFLTVFNTAQAVPITLSADGVDFSAELKTGTSNIGFLFFHGRGSNYNGNYVKQVGKAMNAEGYTTLSLANPVPTTGTSWTSYVNQEDSIDDQVFARIDAALIEMANQGVEHIVLSGLSMGSRMMTASAAAWDLGIFTPSVDIDLVGLIGAGMYAQTGGIPRTLDNPTSIDDFNIYDTHKNLSFIDSIPVLDLFGSNDTTSVYFADDRRNAYAGNPADYIQHQIQCPPNNGQYYAFLGNNKYVPYYGADGNAINRCHQLRDGYLADGNGGYYLDFKVRAPMISNISAFTADYVEPRTKVPEPSSLLLMLMGLPLLLLARRKV